MRGHSELCVAFEAKTELARDAKAGSGVRPIADFTQIIFTAIHLFPHLKIEEIRSAFHLLHVGVF